MPGRPEDFWKVSHHHLIGESDKFMKNLVRLNPFEHRAGWKMWKNTQVFWYAASMRASVSVDVLIRPAVKGVSELRPPDDHLPPTHSINH